MKNRDYLEIMESAATYVAKEKPPMSSPAEVANFLRPLMLNQPQEEFYVLFLNTRNKLIDFIKITTGLVDRTQIHAREVFRAAIINNTTRIVVSHNHPSSDPHPSPQDLESTRNLVAAGKIIGIEVIDHVILGQKTETQPRDYLSFKEENLI